MGYYWANFREVNGDLFRLDTRIYLSNINNPCENDICIGAVVGKNPGSAMPKSNYQSNALTGINLNGDKFLPNVRNIVLKSMREISTNQYIQVLNLFYLCDKNLYKAIARNQQISSKISDSSESKFFPWVWFVWGANSKELLKFKERFTCINSPNKFYFDNSKKEVISCLPPFQKTARHTQGLVHSHIVPYFEQLNQAMNLKG